MIKINDNLFSLDTRDTTYAFHVLPSGHLEHLWYGEKLDLDGGYGPLCEQRVFNGGNMVAYSPEHQQLGLENICLEYSTLGKGDIRDPMIEIQFADGSTTCDFLYQSAQIRPYTPLEGLPNAAGEMEELVVTLQETAHPLLLELTYTPFVDANILVRSAKLINRGEAPVLVRRLLSCQLDLRPGDYTFTSFHGAWVREMERVDIPCIQGRYVNEARTGTSSNRANPFVMLAETGCWETSGRCYGSNLIYSGEHYESIEKNSFGKVRLTTGIHPGGFGWTLPGGESFQAPQAALGFSHQGYDKLSQGFHHFVRHHIVRGPWQFKPRPVLVNSWESTYYDYDEAKILQLAQTAKDTGVELFVLDDGWYGNRNSDDSSLGDWWPNTDKLPGGIAGLSRKITGMGLKFGIWVEPEMISKNSDCYKDHPNWAVQSPGQPHSEGRNQMILDLTMPEVRDYILKHMRTLFGGAEISYVKWDMNRIFSDRYSPSLPPERQGEFMHRYVLGLYEILDILTKEFPDILFESCAGGGNRPDLGMLCYMQQLWISDNTDAICRASIQHNYSYGYPPSIMGNHVSECPNHQTLRMVPLRTRFHVACFGVMGYECDLSKMNEEGLQRVRDQISFYKEHRELFQFGHFHRLECPDGETQWMVVDSDGKNAFALYLRTLAQPNVSSSRLAVRGLNDNKTYRVSGLTTPVNSKIYGHLFDLSGTPEPERVIASGQLLNLAGLQMRPVFCGTGYSAQLRLAPDFSSWIYQFTEEA